MIEFDLFANQLLEEAKRFREKATECADSPAKVANLHASLTLLFCALEAHVNAISEEFATRAELSIHERGFLLERLVKLDDGEFKIQVGLKMTKLEDRIEFLYTKFSGSPLDRKSVWWGKLSAAIAARNQLTHAKSVPAISEGTVKSATEAIVETLDEIYRGIYKRGFPAAVQGIQSQLVF